MSVHEYQPGPWTALVADGAVALLHPGVPDDVTRELWQLASAGWRLGAWVEYLAGAGIATLPSFAMVEAHEEGLRVLVRGDVDVAVGDHVVSGRGYATWREEVVAAADDVTLSAGPVDPQWLPVAGGIVRAGAVRLADGAVQEPSSQDLPEDDDVELTVARMPALAAAMGAAEPDVVQPEVAKPEVAQPEAEEAPAAQPEVGKPEAEEAAPAADVDAVADPVDDVDGEDTDDDYDHLLWSTEQLDAHARSALQGAAGRDEDPAPAVAAGPGAGASPDTAAAPPTDPSPDASAGQPAQVSGATPADGEGIDLEATRAPEPEPGLEPESGLEPEPGHASAPGPAPADSWAAAAPQWQPPPLIDSVPGRLAPPARPVEQPAAPVGPPVGPPVDLAPPAPGVTDDGDHDGQTILTSDLPAAPGPVADEPAPPPVPRVELVLSNGPRIEMDRPVLLGRAPEAARFAGSEAPRLVSVPSPEKDVSATHVEVRPAGGHVVVTDMSSTNGTVVRLPGQPEMRLQPGTGVPVAPGAVVELGVGVSLTVAEIEGAP